MKAAAIMDIGKIRKSNQDFFYYTNEAIGKLPNLYIVADGMGGHNAGDFASKYTVETLVKLIKDSEYTDVIKILTNAISEVNSCVLEQARLNEEYAGMGTTVVVATIIDNTLKVANLGDSRLYLIDEDILQITRDHSLVEEMVFLGQITKEEAKTHSDKNIITRAIGVESSVMPEIFSVDLKKEDTILICTDGLTNMVSDEKICQIVKNGGSCENIANKLIRTANENGGKDNITAMIIKS